MCLSVNREVLQAAGHDLAYPGRDGVPGGKLRLQLLRPRHGEHRIAQFGRSVRQHLDGFRNGPDRSLILSEENIPGPMHHFFESRFFPAAGKRFAALRAAFDAPPAHVLFVVRPYAELYVSAYRKRAEDNPMAPFSEVAPQYLAMDRGWPELVAEMRDRLGPDRLTVVQYKDRGASRDLLARLVPGLDGASLAEPDRAVNLSPTDTALIALQARYRAGEKLSRPAWQAVIRAHADAREPLGVAAFSDPDAARLDARYQADLDRLANLDGIKFT
jgi:hypothetical protein